jgi:hypothetical protein
VEISTLRLPGIGHRLQWREDGFWRELSDDQYRDEAFPPADEEWVAWSGHVQPQARGGEWGGVSTWWLVYGELPRAGPATPGVVLDDGTRPPVHVLGRVWAGEWQAVAQPVTVRVAEHRFVLPFREPMYRRTDGDPAAGPGWWRSAADG